MYNHKFFSFLFLLITIAGCNHRTTSAYYNWEPTYIKSEFAGSEVFKIYSKGDDKAESIEQAKVDILKRIIFNGVKGSPDARPIIFEVNAQQKYSSFFNEFFAEKGAYRDYVTLYRQGNLNRNDKIKTGRRNDQKKKGIELLVNKPELIKLLANANIIPKK